ncbi:NAD(+) diphosphatase [Actibacterium sp. XHP0104]|uniref:NAD(+) diphosphatase n=1 Tax=Actibacterium sp. XHP0104 TaxID=2984335 RepID=UPI0021E77D55|nr:NAD(+) diphosphatase [Actibacterium sp. XHP0104]MCV2882831.1 NAD(+) diphosphatase [Actibacterium sp. XHP0104]
MRLAETVTFGGAGIDRAAEMRGDADALAVAWPEARVVPLWRGKPLIRGEDLDALGHVPGSHPVVAARQARAVLLGRADGAVWFAVDMSDWQPEDLAEGHDSFVDLSEQRHPDLPDDTCFAELRRVMARLSPRDAELAATAKAILGWHRSHGFCSCCGGRSALSMAGWHSTCATCGAHHFPRTDPVVIMLITHGNSVLVGRSPGWPEGMYSLLAGFVEPGETIEAAVRREVAEETGVQVGEVRYLASQPWPFPASLMLGCSGVALGREITLDPHELDDALWISREEMLRVFADEHPLIRRPRRGAIAGFLLENWLADRLA